MKNNIIKIIIIVVVIAMIIGLYFIKHNFNDNYYTKDEISFNETKAVKMINFVSPNCLACVKMEGLMKEIISEYEGKAEIIEIDIMENSEISNKYNIIYTPTQVFFDEEGNEITRHEGFIGKKDLVLKLESLGVEKDVWCIRKYVVNYF